MDYLTRATYQRLGRPAPYLAYRAELEVIDLLAQDLTEEPLIEAAFDYQGIKPLAQTIDTVYGQQGLKNISLCMNRDDHIPTSFNRRDFADTKKYIHTARRIPRKWN